MSPSDISEKRCENLCKTKPKRTSRIPCKCCVSLGKPWTAVGGRGRPWTAVDGSGQPWSVDGRGRGRPWAEEGGRGWPWTGSVPCTGPRPWTAVGGRGRPWTAVDSRGRWMAVAEDGRGRRRVVEDGRGRFLFRARDHARDRSWAAVRGRGRQQSWTSSLVAGAAGGGARAELCLRRLEGRGSDRSATGGSGASGDPARPGRTRIRANPERTRIRANLDPSEPGSERTPIRSNPDPSEPGSGGPTHLPRVDPGRPGCALGAPGTARPGCIHLLCFAVACCARR